GPPPATRGTRAAEPQRPLGEAAVPAVARDQVARIEHRGDGAFLIEPALPALDDVGAQDQAVPVPGNVVECPECRRDRLLAHLLRHGHPELLDLTVGVIRSDADPEASAVLQQHELDLAAGALAHGLDAVASGEPRAPDPIED